MVIRKAGEAKPEQKEELIEESVAMTATDDTGTHLHYGHWILGAAPGQPVTAANKMDSP